MGGALNAPQEGLADVSGSALALLARHLVVGAGHGLLHELPVAFARLKRDVEEVDATHVLEAAEILALDRTSQRAPCKAAKAKKKRLAHGERGDSRGRQRMPRWQACRNHTRAPLHGRAEAGKIPERLGLSRARRATTHNTQPLYLLASLLAGSGLREEPSAVQPARCGGRVARTFCLSVTLTSMVREWKPSTPSGKKSEAQVKGA